MSDEGNGMAHVDLSECTCLVIRRRGTGLLTLAIEDEHGNVDSGPALVDIGAFLTDLQLDADDCRKALDDFHDQGLDRPGDAS